MTKNEAIKMIAEELDVVPKVSESFSAEFPKQTAEAILNKMLKAGFGIPERTYEDWTGYGTIQTTDRSWAPENGRKLE